MNDSQSQISDIKSEIADKLEPSFSDKLIHYLYVRVRQLSSLYDDDDIELYPEWIPSRIRLPTSVHNVHPHQPGFVLDGDHDCGCGVDGRIICYSSTHVPVRIPLLDCEILAFAVNGKRAIVLAERASGNPSDDGHASETDF